MVGRSTIGVLYVDDDPELLSLLTAFLERREESFELFTEGTATDALARLTNDGDHIDVLVSDYSLPDTDGLAFLEEVRALDSDLPFIFYTGSGDKKQDALARGATGYVVKGELQTLHSLIDHIITSV